MPLVKFILRLELEKIIYSVTTCPDAFDRFFFQKSNSLPDHFKQGPGQGTQIFR